MYSLSLEKLRSSACVLIVMELTSSDDAGE